MGLGLARLLQRPACGEELGPGADLVGVIEDHPYTRLEHPVVCVNTESVAIWLGWVAVPINSCEIWDEGGTDKVASICVSWSR